MSYSQKKRDEYFEKYKDPRWQKMRLEVLSRDEFACQKCAETEKTLHVHHRYYMGGGKDPWEYPLEALVTLCVECHEYETEAMRDAIHDLGQSMKIAGFLSEDVKEFVPAVADMPMTHLPEVVATAMAWAFQDAEMQRIIVEKYLAGLEQRAKT